jgi:tetratricopeptide (TPR) repeat protein
MKHTPIAAIALLAAAYACGPRIEPVRPIQPNGAIVPSRTDETVDRARAEGEAERARLADERRRNESAALVACTGTLCDAVARGELALGMTREQVLAVTRSGPGAWETRGDRRTSTLAARDEAHLPADRVAPVAYVLMENGRVRSFAYQEPEGVRLVASPADASQAGRGRARAASLLREGDDFAARGDFRAALDRYDRADLLDPNSPETTLKIARALDKQLRPYEATVRYRLFLHQLELERIRAQGEAYAHLYAAAAEARDRIVVLERRGR